MNQADWENRYSRKLVVSAVKAEIASQLDGIREPIVDFLSELYVLGDMELSHAFGSWYRKHDGEDFPLQEILDMEAVIFDEQRHVLSSRLILNPGHEAALQDSFKSELPMIEPPRLVVDNHNNGRHVIKEHVMCGTPYARHEGDLCLDVFNFLSQQKWRLLETLPGTSKNLESQPDFEKHQTRIRSMIGDRPVWFPWCCDSRGRMYARNHWFNPQGDDAGKASVTMWEGQVVRREGKFAMWADLGSALGLDKLTWVQRAIKARKAFQKGADWAYDMYKPEDINILSRTWEACEKMVAGEPVDHMVALDATSSGMQLASCMVGDEATMKATNAIFNGTRSDAYSVAHEAFIEAHGKGEYSRSDFKQALMTMAYGSTAMPKSIFGEDVDLFLSTMNQVFPGPMYVNKVLQSLFNYQALTHEWDLPDGFHAKVASHKVFQKERDTDYGPVFFGVDTQYPGEKERGMAANTIHSLDSYVLREVIRLCNYDDAMLNQVHSILFSEYEMKDLDVSPSAFNVLNCWRKTGIASYRMFAILKDEPALKLHMTQKEIRILQEMWSKCEGRKIQIMTIHDCFRCHVNDAWIVRKYYALVLANITRGNFLKHMVNTLAEGNIQLVEVEPEVKEELAKRVEKSVYAIC